MTFISLNRIFCYIFFSRASASSFVTYSDTHTHADFAVWTGVPVARFAYLVLASHILLMSKRKYKFFHISLSCSVRFLWVKKRHICVIATATRRAQANLLTIYTKLQFTSVDREKKIKLWYGVSHSVTQAQCPRCGKSRKRELEKKKEIFSFLFFFF